MQSETKQCQNCNNSFTIEPDDFSFYEKIKVPPPTLCPDCRMQRKYIWRNERTLYRRNCDKTGKSIVSMYAPDSRFTVYDVKEYWSDSWDSKDYGQDIDFNRPFFEQFKELQTKVPRLALMSKNSINSDYSNHTNNSKDCYMCTSALNAENCIYSQNVLPAKNSCDVYRTEGTSNENLYECINVHDCYECQYCYLIANSFNCYYSFDLRNCSNCFLSYNLRGQSYCFMNQKLSREEYLEKMKEFNLSSYEVRQKLYEMYVDMILNKALHRATVIESSLNCTGNMIYNSKDSKDCFECEKIESSRNIAVANNITDSYDLYHIGGMKCDLMYECHASMGSSNMKFTHLSYENTNLTYCDSCNNSNELFGCVGVKKGSYMILNKQYSKEEYTALKGKLIEYMIQTGEYGSFFPPDLSPFAYNESQAHVYMPFTKELATEKGFRWKDDLPGTYGKETIQPENIPDKIQEIPDSYNTEIFRCSESGRNYNIVKPELEFYKQHNIPIPRIHPDERYKNRINLRPGRKLYDAICAISGERIQTAYPPDRRPKMIVSDEVYKKEVL